MTNWGGGVAVPVSATAWGLPGKLSTNDNVAVLLPVVCGEKETVKVALELAGMVSGNVGVVPNVNSVAFVPVIVTEVMTRLRLEEPLVAVIVIGALVVIAC